MASTKTAKKSSSKAVPAKSKSTSKSVKQASVRSRFSSPVTISSVRNSIKDPKNRRTLILAGVLLGLGALLIAGRSLFVAATVNGQPVSRFAVISELEKQSGRAILDSMITRTLVFQEADKKKLSVGDQEIDAEIGRIRKQFQDQGQNLDQLLQAQGLSQEKFREEVRVQVIVTKILGDQAKVSDKEFNEFLAKNQDLLENEEDKETATKNLRMQMEQQKLAQKYQEWIANVKKNAKINYLVSY